MIRAAKAWGMRPSELGICAPDADLTYMVAWERAEGNMVAWERQEIEREQRQKARRPRVGFCDQHSIEAT